MKTIFHPSENRGSADHGWLKAKHSFSFASYYNPEKVHFGMLRVLNDDIVSPGTGFGTHPHDNMEIVTIPLKGVLAHRDSMGHVSTIQPGEVQIMSAGTGVTHSEYNHSKSEPINLLQLWIFPNQKNVKPRYGQKSFELSDLNSFTEIISPEQKDGNLWLHQDAWLSLGNIESGKTIEYKVHKKISGVYFFLISGKMEIAEKELKNRDAIGVWETDSVQIKAMEDSRLLAIEVPMSLDDSRR